MTLAASCRDCEASLSPSAAITLARASLAASASAAMALWSWRGSITSFSSTIWTLTPHGSVASSKVSYKLSGFVFGGMKKAVRVLLKSQYALMDWPDIKSHTDYPPLSTLRFPPSRREYLTSSWSRARSSAWWRPEVSLNDWNPSWSHHLIIGYN